MGFTNINTRGPVLITLCGLPGSGKTTMAKEVEKTTGAVRLNTGEWQAAPGIDFFDDEFRHTLEVRLNQHGITLLKLGQSIILEDRPWRRDECDRHRELAHKLGAAIEFHYFDVPVDELWRRIERKAGSTHGTQGGQKLHMPGSPAITPHMNLDAASAAANLPTFTKEDAIAWAQAHSPFRMVPIGAYTVSNVRFITSAQLSTETGGEPTGLLPQAQVCVVELQGEFVAPAAPGASNRISQVIEVFDARTGNFIMAGGKRL